MLCIFIFISEINYLPNVPKTSKKYTDYIQNPSLNSMLLEQIDQQHIIDAANKLKPKTSSGPR